MRRRNHFAPGTWALLALSALAGCRTPRPAPAHRPDWRAVDHAEAARAAREKSDFSTAERELREAIALDPQWIEARFALQDLQFSMLRRMEALEEAKALRARTPSDPVAMLLELRAQQGSARDRVAAALPRDSTLAPWIEFVRMEDRDMSGASASWRAAPSEEPRIREWWDRSARRHRASLAAIRAQFDAAAVSEFLGEPPSALRAAWLLEAQEDLSRGLGSQALADLTAQLQPLFGEMLQIPEGIHALEAAVHSGMRERQRLALERELHKLPLPSEGKRDLRVAHVLLSATLHCVRNEPHMERLDLEEAWRLGARSMRVVAALRRAALRTGDGARAIAVHHEWASRWGEPANLPNPLGALAAAFAEEQARPIAENAQIAAELALSAGWHEEALELAARAAVRGDLRLPLFANRIISPELLASRLGHSAAESRASRPQAGTRKPSRAKLRAAIRAVDGAAEISVQSDGWLGWTLRASLGPTLSVVAGSRALHDPSAFVTNELSAVEIVGLGNVMISHWEPIPGWGVHRVPDPMAFQGGRGSLDVQQLERLADALERRAKALSRIPPSPFDARLLPAVPAEEQRDQRTRFEVEWRLLQGIEPQRAPAVATEILARLHFARASELQKIKQRRVPRPAAILRWTAAPSIAETMLFCAERDAWLATVAGSTSPRAALAVATDRTLHGLTGPGESAVVAALDLWLQQFQEWSAKHTDRIAHNRPLLPQAALLTDAEAAAIAREALAVRDSQRAAATR
ncbi:MAG: hypothetical protein JNJ88_00590 [Planctomycetes bacterium]|nr:hypothetical protein [Planctomycetota bacterium]